MTHSIKFLKEAYKAGATHTDPDGRAIKYVNGARMIMLDGGWWIFAMEKKFNTPSDLAIDFSPLEDYYADKDLDIRVTGVGE